MTVEAAGGYLEFITCMFPPLFARSDGTRCQDLSFLNVEF